MKNNSASVVFIVGSSRSGTTMFNRILGNHSKFLALNELHFIGVEWNVFDGDSTWPRNEVIKKSSKLLAVARRSIWDAKPSNDEVKESEMIFSPEETGEGLDPATVFSEVISHLLDHEGKKIATDQTPRNILYVDQVLEALPNARVIQLVRDPRAVLFSQKNRWRQKWLGAKSTPLLNTLRVYANYHPYTMLKLWNAAYLKGKNVNRHPRFMSIQFENLVEMPEKSLQDICNFLDIEYEEAMRDVPRVGSSNLEHRIDVRGISSDVVNTWDGELSTSELWLCQKMSGVFMNELGYDSSRIGFPWFEIIKLVLLYPFHIIGVLTFNPRLAARIFRAIRIRS